MVNVVAQDPSKCMITRALLGPGAFVVDCVAKEGEESVGHALTFSREQVLALPSHEGRFTVLRLMRVPRTSLPPGKGWVLEDENGTRLQTTNPVSCFA
jgi:hypothetical protein